MRKENEENLYGRKPLMHIMEGRPEAALEKLVAGFEKEACSWACMSGDGQVLLLTKEAVTLLDMPEIDALLTALQTAKEVASS